MDFAVYLLKDLFKTMLLIKTVLSEDNVKGLLKEIQNS